MRAVKYYFFSVLLVLMLAGIGLAGTKDGSVFAALELQTEYDDEEEDEDEEEPSQIPESTPTEFEEDSEVNPATLCKILDLTADYDPEEKRVEIDWTKQNAQSVNIFVNDVEISPGNTGSSWAFTYALQPGASYTVTAVPIDEKGEEGEAMSVPLDSEGSFESPQVSKLTASYAAIKDSKGVSYGFAKPSVIVSWEGQEDAHYAIYRAPKNQRSQYTWVATVFCDKEGICTFTDENAAIGKNYYAICQVITADTYIENEISTAISPPAVINMAMPKAKLAASQQEDGTIALTMGASRAYVAGYRIYRKNSKGKYEMIAETSSNTYLDDTAQFGKTYSYKVRCFYSDPVTGGRSYGKYSKAARVKNTVGKLGASVKHLSARKVKISWNKPANAKKYEVYYKTQTDGDSYSLLSTTKARSITASLKKGKSYDVMIKAYCQTNSGKEYFSCAFVSFTMGFSAPANGQIKTTSYTYNSAARIFIQKDTLTWDRVYGASGYYVECYNPVTKKFEVIAKIKGSANAKYSVSNNVVSDLQAKQYRISAYYKKKTQTGTIINVTVGLDTVRGIKVKTSKTQAVISWKGSTGAQLYNIYRSNGRFTELIGTTTSYSYKDAATSQGVEYIYYVQAVNSSMNLKSALSEGISYTRKIDKVTKLKAVNQKKNKVKLTWTKQKASEGYIIYYRSADDDVYTKLAELSEKKTSYTHRSLKQGTTYYYRIVSIYHNSASIAAQSSATSAKVKVKK